MIKLIQVAYLVSMLLLSNFAAAESIKGNCEKATSQPEQLFCNNQTLQKLDKVMAKAYRNSLNKYKTRKILLEYQQSAWLEERKKCSDVSCLIELYKQRITALKNPKSYALVMSKDTRLCGEMNKVFNQAKREHGKMLFNKHSIEWQAVPGAQWARFDIDNDGADELVFKVVSYLNEIPGENLYIFPPNSDLLIKWKSLENRRFGPVPKELFDTRNKFDPQKYFLKDLPQTFEKALMDNARKQLPDSIKGNIKDADLRPFITRSFILEPFEFDKTTYVSMSDLISNWIVVAKYMQPDEMEDFCYFYNPDSKYH